MATRGFLLDWIIVSTIEALVLSSIVYEKEKVSSSGFFFPVRSLVLCPFTAHGLVDTSWRVYHKPMSTEIFPVVHIQDAEQALDQSSMALEMGADGVYLIDHGGHPPADLIHAFNQVKEAHPERFVGINVLQSPSAAATLTLLLDISRKGDMVALPDGLWEDNAELDKDRVFELRALHPELTSIRYLGGVAFKYTPLFTEDPGLASQEARRLEPYVDVVTTSGAGTGKAPTPEKIRAMKAAIGKKLAVASGISAQNFAQYDGSFDQLLVSTSVETEPYSGIFDPQKLQELIDVAHGSSSIEL